MLFCHISSRHLSGFWRYLQMHMLLGNKTQYFIKICVKAFGVFVVVKMVDYCLMLNFAKM